MSEVSNYNGTQFAAIYNCFLGKITDDMYMELTPEDTVKDLQRLLVDAIPGFEFPRHNLYNYQIHTEVINESDISSNDFVIGVVWEDLEDDEESTENVEDELAAEPTPPKVVVEHSCFADELNQEEINILAILMMNGWLQRQITSIENVRMKYSGSDFKMTSQANHLSKLMTLLSELQRQSTHMQRLYKRRRISDGLYRSNWDTFNYGTTR